jgi:predicted ribosomally synthesized peptide with SipW-like signal peptide
MNKILISLSVIGVVSAIAVGGTMAYFSDTVTSTGNTFSTGTLDLKVGNQDDPNVVHITRANLQPNPRWSHSYGGQWDLKNTGSIPGVFKITIKNIKNYENTCLDMETDAGDTTCGVGADQGELGNLMYARWSRNAAPWGHVYGSLMNPFNSAEGVVITGDVINPGEIAPAVYLDLEWDTHAGNQDNLGQNDGLEFDVEFSLDQVVP